MRILHLADLHIGKLFYNIHLTEDQGHVLGQITDIVRDEGVDVVVIAGDVYDRSVPPVQATVVMDNFLSTLILELNKKVIIIPGNHDSPERIGFGNRLLREKGLFIASKTDGTVAPIVLADAGGEVTFYPIPYVEPIDLKRTLDDKEIIDFESAMRKILTGIGPVASRSVAISHCFAQGGEESESERPLSIGGSYRIPVELFNQFTLTLLGHLHRPQHVVGSVYYAGSPLKYSFSEINHEKKATIYDLDGNGTVQQTPIPLSPLRNLRKLEGVMDEIIRASTGDPAKNDYLWVNLTDRGALFNYAARIRECYPNVVNITRSEFQREVQTGAVQDIRRLTETEVLNSFFCHVTGGGLTDDEVGVMNDILHDLEHGVERGIS